MDPVKQDLLTDWVPARWPDQTVLSGRDIRLERLNPTLHGDALWETTGGLHNAALWQYMVEGPFADRSEFDAATRRAAAEQDPSYFAIVDQTTGQALGRCSLLNIRPNHGVVEIGHIMFSDLLQRTRAATEVLYLMAKYSFEELGYRRYEWKCNAANAKSRQAALRLGFVFEGIFRQHMIVKGYSRDTAWFAMLDGDWPQIRAALEDWLKPKNFQANGRQINRLKVG